MKYIKLFEGFYSKERERIKDHLKKKIQNLYYNPQIQSVKQQPLKVLDLNIIQNIVKKIMIYFTLKVNQMSQLTTSKREKWIE